MSAESTTGPAASDEVQSRLGRVAARLLWVVSNRLARIYWRLEVVGGARVPVVGAFVLAPSHRSNLDFLLAGLATRRPVRYMAKSTIFKGGWIDRFLVGLGSVPGRAGHGGS